MGVHEVADRDTEALVSKVREQVEQRVWTSFEQRVEHVIQDAVSRATRELVCAANDFRQLWQERDSVQRSTEYSRAVTRATVRLALQSACRGQSLVDDKHLEKTPGSLMVEERQVLVQAIQEIQASAQRMEFARSQIQQNLESAAVKIQAVERGRLVRKQQNKWVGFATGTQEEEDLERAAIKIQAVQGDRQV